MAVVFDSDLTISGWGNPIQGSVSLSPDESDIVIAKFEGGRIAGVKGNLKYTLKASFFGASGATVSSGGNVTLSTSGGNSFTLTNCVIIQSVGWNSDTGFTTEISVTGEPN